MPVGIDFPFQSCILYVSMEQSVNYLFCRIDKTYYNLNYFNISKNKKYFESIINHFYTFLYQYYFTFTDSVPKQKILKKEFNDDIIITSNFWLKIFVPVYKIIMETNHIEDIFVFDVNKERYMVSKKDGFIYNLDCNYIFWKTSNNILNIKQKNDIFGNNILNITFKNKKLLFSCEPEVDTLER